MLIFLRLKPGSIPTQNLPRSSVPDSKPSTRSSPRKRKRQEWDENDHVRIPPSNDIVHEPEIDMLPDARQVQLTRNSEVKIKLLTQKLRRAQKMISRKNALICKLKGELTRLQNCGVQNKADIIQFFGSNSNTEAHNFFKSQIINSRRKNKGRRYSDEDKTVALSIYYCSSKCYKLLRKLFCLPTIRSLRRWLQNLEVCPGLNENILSLMKLKAEKLAAPDKVVSVVIDEMSLKENVTYNARTDEFDGFINHGQETDSLTHANQALVVLVRGLKLNFKQVVGYYLSKDAMGGDRLKDIIINVVKKIMATGFIPKVVVCDQGSNNLKMRSLLGITECKPFIEVSSNKVYFFHDAPHLLKSLRNNFKKYDIICDDGRCSWSHIIDFYNKDKDMKPRLAPKLSKLCMELPPFSPMRVCLAAHVLSHSVSCGIKTHITFNSMSSEASPTATFIEKIDTLFDIFNSIQNHSAKEFQCSLNDERKHLLYLNEISSYMRKMVVLNGRGNVPPCIKGWIENISALSLLWSDLKSNFGFSYLLTRRLTQDCIENLFSVIRGKGGNNVTPDASKFRYSLRLAMTNQLLLPSENSNCALDASQFLLLKSELECVQVPLTIINNVAQNIVDTAEEIPENLVQECACQYVCGWLCSKLPHEKCRSSLSSYNENMSDLKNTHILFKQYDNAKLLFPNTSANLLYKEIAYVFKIKFSSFLRESRLKVKTKLKKNIKMDSYSFMCKDCISIFVEKCINVLIQCFLREENEKRNQRCLRKNTKAKKVMHM